MARFVWHAPSWTNSSFLHVCPTCDFWFFHPVSRRLQFASQLLLTQKITVTCEMFKTSDQTWKHLMNGDFGVPFQGPVIESAKDQPRLYQFGKKVVPGLFLAYALYASKGECKGNNNAENGERFIFPIADGTVKWSGEEHKDDLQGDSDGSQPSDTMTDDSEARNDFFGQSQGSTFIVITLNQGLNSMCTKEESFSRPLRYILTWSGEQILP